ncbi:MAG: mechanosensitive ion channel family protein, partial [Flavobacteriales bacterium]
MALGNIFSYSQRILQAIVGYMPTLISSILVLVIGFYAIGWLMRLLNAAMEKKEFDISLQSFVRSLINVVLKVILLITVAGMLGIHTTSFVAVLGAAGLAVGLALQGSLSNFAGGVLILFFKPYKVGDTIEVGGTTGDVLEIQIFNTILKTSDHRTIILPNGSVS